MSDTQFAWYMVVNALVALGTIGAVIAALFGKPIISKFFPPSFSISILRPVGELIPLMDGAGRPAGNARYFHLQVRNLRGWSRATHAQLRLVRVETAGPDQQFQIEWDGDIPIRRQHQQSYPSESEIGYSPVNFDLCELRGGTQPVLSLMPIIRATNLPYQWAEDAHLIAAFQVKSPEAESRVVRIQIDWDGAWHTDDGESAKHLKLRVLVD
jgi:hypothetical protein